jgi:hypothetical protein
MSAQQNFDGLHVLDKRKIFPQESRARLAGRARLGRVRGPKFEVFETSNHELRTSDRAFLACLARHAPRSVTLADFVSAHPGHRTQ